MPLTCWRSALPFTALIAMLALLAACATAPQPAPEPAFDPPAPSDEPATPDEPEDDVDDSDEPDGEEPLGEAPTTDREAHEGDGTQLAVIDVRVGTHEGFDRVVFELSGSGAGWSIEYGEATGQGSGMPVDVDGGAVLRVAIHGVGYPDDLPDDIVPWTESVLAGPGTSVIEVVHDALFEGIHTFLVGTADELPFFVAELDDPDRIVIDVVHAMH